VKREGTPEATPSIVKIGKKKKSQHIRKAWDEPMKRASCGIIVAREK